MAATATRPTAASSPLDAAAWQERLDERHRLAELLSEDQVDQVTQVVRSVKPPPDIGPHKRDTGVWDVMHKLHKDEAAAVMKIAAVVDRPKFHRDVVVEFDALPPASDHGGHEPDYQVAESEPNGKLRISTSIGSQSSNLRSSAAVGVLVTPEYATALLTATPWIDYSAWHWLKAAGTGESHSRGWVGSAIYSRPSSGGNWTQEGVDNRQEIWNSRCSAGFMGWPEEDGHDYWSTPEPPPDNKGSFYAFSMTPGIPVQVVTKPNYVYHAQAFIEIESDADGDGTPAYSGARVDFFAQVWDFIVDQQQI